MGNEAQALDDLLDMIEEGQREELRRDPWVVAKVNNALSEWQGILRPEEMDWAFEQLIALMVYDDFAANTLRKARRTLHQA
jgi:hypothetical protein